MIQRFHSPAKDSKGDVKSKIFTRVKIKERSDRIGRLATVQSMFEVSLGSHYDKT